MLGRRAWHEATLADPQCAACKGYGDVQGHHVVTRQKVRKVNGDQWDLRNRLSVCAACHHRHHESSGRHRIRRRVLRPENLTFARELLGDRAADYLDRHYARD